MRAVQATMRVPENASYRVCSRFELVAGAHCWGALGSGVVAPRRSHERSFQPHSDRPQ